MAEHYYTARPESKSAERTIEAALCGLSLQFITDAGVFSRGHIDPGTRLLVEAAPLPDEGALLDLGCGYGVIGIAAAKLRPRLRVVMVDVNERAVALARRNAALNGVPGVDVRLSDGFAGLESGMHFRAILTNPPYRAGKELVYQLIADAKERLEPGGLLVVVGHNKQGVKSLKKHMQDVFGNAEDLAKEGGYRVVASRRL